MCFQKLAAGHLGDEFMVLIIRFPTQRKAKNIFILLSTVKSGKSSLVCPSSLFCLEYSSSHEGYYVS